ncbi:MAG: hypothetical protein KDC55_02880 [Ignavibacteriae bacterium]|nr:hypothetical protein [Ignavibacteriota bacterium]
MRIKTLEDWNNSKFKQHPLLYLLILFIPFNLTLCTNVEKVNEGDNEYGYVSYEDSVSNLEFVKSVSNYIIPIILTSQLLIIYWVFNKKRNISKKKPSEYNDSMFYVIWFLMLNVLYLIMEKFFHRDTLYYAYIVYLIYVPYFIGQIFFLFISVYYLRTNYYVLCQTCFKKNEISNDWFEKKTKTLLVNKTKCSNCKSEVNLELITPLVPDEDYILFED